MRIEWAYKRQPLSGHDALIAACPDKDFNSPCCSTIPLLEYWRFPEERVGELSDALGLVSPPRVRLDFEHTVSPPRGRGPASHTDLMVTAPGFAVAIEAKWTEPRYQLVRDWLRNSENKANKEKVLRGWCDLLERRSDGRIVERDLETLPYQMIHRAASACHAAGAKSSCWLVYQVFEAAGNSLDACLADLHELGRVLGPDSSLGIAVIECGVDPSNTLSGLRTRWGQGARQLARFVRPALASGELLSVSLDRVHRVRSG